MSDTSIALARIRFAKVMASRKTSKELIALVRKLAESEKFLPAVKPYCMADLLWACTEWVADSNIEDLLVAIHSEWAGDVIRLGNPERTDFFIKGIVRRALEIATQDDTLERRLRLMRFGGLIQSNEHALNLAIQAGLPASEQRRLKEALTRLAARPKIEEPCPF